MNEFQQLGVGQQAGQQLAPQGFFGSMFGAPLGGMIGRGIGGLLGNAQLGGQIGQLTGGVGGGFLPLAADPYQQQMAQLAQQGQLAPQGWFGNAISQFGKPLGGLIGGLSGNQQIGSTIGGIASQFGGLLPFGAAAQQGGSPQIQQIQQQEQQLLQQLHQLLHLQQQMQQQQQQQAGAQGGQLAPQGWFGNALSQLGQPLGGVIGGLAGNQQLGSTIGGIASQLGGMLPFSASPSQQAGAQQGQGQDQQIAGQFLQQHPLLQAVLQHPVLAQQFLQSHPLLQQALQDPQAAVQLVQQHPLLQQALQHPLLARQIMQQHPLLHQALQQRLMQQMQQIQQPQQQAGAAGQAGQPGQIAPQGWFGNALSQLGQPLGGLLGGLAGNQQLGNTIGGIASQFGGMLPFSADPYQMQQLAQQQQQQQQPGQLAPQGWFGNAISQFGKPLGGLIGGLAGNQQLGNTIGGIASQFGGMLPFGADPYQQFAQQAQPGQFPIYQAYGGQGQAQQGNGSPYTVH